MGFRRNPDRCRDNTNHCSHWYTYRKDHRHSQLGRMRGDNSGLDQILVGAVPEYRERERVGTKVNWGEPERAPILAT